MIGVYKSEPLKPVIDADHMPFHQIIRKLGLAVENKDAASKQTPESPLRHSSFAEFECIEKRRCSPVCNAPRIYIERPTATITFGHTQETAGIGLVGIGGPSGPEPAGLNLLRATSGESDS